MRILLFGKNGQVGSALEPRIQRLGSVVSLGRSDLDLTDIDGIGRCIAEHQPEIIINAAAYTAVDKAEKEPDLASIINSDAPAAMASAAKDIDAMLIHYSTDYVFNGTASTPYKEDQATAPNSVYGRSKWAGEQAIAEAGVAYLIFRTAWVYSLHGHNFLKTMLRLGEERSELGVVDDQIGSPTFAGAIANATLEVLLRIQKDGGLREDQCGLYHMTCGSETSWYGFTKKIFEIAGLKGVKLDAISTDQYPTPAARPAYSVLCNDKLRNTFGVELPHWEQCLSQCLSERDGTK
ncbi:MAG TPA: dTDP-4-dehydrorhamnose reductase [Acidiferrobacteraceae bacterium]|nr:dTDP-4-dehydrorhamnose reductase [Acidiferrobacteraceae bacterium]